MKISVFGLGYVGAVTTACLARQGHHVVGVDVQESKVQMLDRGEAPIIEPGLSELLASARTRGLLRATTDSEEAVRATEVSYVCVGTPSTPTGGIDLRYVRQVAGEIGGALKSLSRPHAVVFRSTMLPGSTRTLVETVLRTANPGASPAVFYYPEFLREGTAVEDFLRPSLSVVGTEDGGPVAERWRDGFVGESSVVSWEAAEMLKYACNAFHATKITFANEMGRLGKALGVDAMQVMALLCEDRKLNISTYYLRPGNPFGGSCLPKDVRAVTQLARQLGATLPVLESLLPSNEQHLRSLLGRVEALGGTEVVILGLSFKPDTDDLRESAMVEVAQNLLGRGYRLRIYDPQLNLARLVGSNKRLIDTRMPHLASLLQPDLGAALGTSGVVLAAQRCASMEELRSHLTADHRLVDVNGWPELRTLGVPYEGFCW